MTARSHDDDNTVGSVSFVTGPDREEEDHPETTARSYDHDDTTESIKALRTTQHYISGRCFMFVIT